MATADKVFSFTVSPAAVAGAAYPIPSLQDERNTYTGMGLTWSPSIEPNFPVNSVNVPAIHWDNDNFPNLIGLHQDTEADDLWINLVQYQRTNQPGYLDRATKWRNTWVNYVEPASRPRGAKYEGPGGDGGGCDHLYGWGLLRWYERSITLGSPDTAARDRAIDLAEEIAHVSGPDTIFNAVVQNGGFLFGTRIPGRHIHLLTELIRVLGNINLSNRTSGGGTIPAQTLLNQQIDMALSVSQWNSTYGFYVNDFDTDATNVGGPGAFAAGLRATSTFQVAIICNALFTYWWNNRTSSDPATITRLATVRSRLVAMANWCNTYGLHPTYQLCSSWQGVYTQNFTHNGIPHTAGQGFWSFDDNAPGTPTSWDPYYTISIVNPLVIGYKFTGNVALLNKAKTAWQRHNGAKWQGNPPPFNVNDRYPLVHHFLNTIRDANETPNTYDATAIWGYNKAEVEYSYLLLENGGSPTLIP